MKILIVMRCFPISIFVGYGEIVTEPESLMNTFKVRHTVVFSLKHPKGSAEEKEFMQAARKLSSIPGVLHFECLRQISKKNSFDYGLSMEFETSEAYEAYQKFPAHEEFVQTYWINNVKDFLEIDYETLA